MSTTELSNMVKLDSETELGTLQESMETIVKDTEPHSPQVRLCKRTPYVRPAPKIGRNENCQCGSGKKFKKCCGRPIRRDMFVVNK